MKAHEDWQPPKLFQNICEADDVEFCTGQDTGPLVIAKVWFWNL